MFVIPWGLAPFFALIALFCHSPLAGGLIKFQIAPPKTWKQSFQLAHMGSLAQQRDVLKKNKKEIQCPNKLAVWNVCPLNDHKQA